jgi:hypothetical protein
VWPRTQGAEDGSSSDTGQAAGGSTRREESRAGQVVVRLMPLPLTP